MSRQLVGNVREQSELDSSSSNYDTIKDAIQLGEQGRIEEAYRLFESLPAELKQTKLIMRLRVQWGLQVDLEKALQLLDEFKQKFPGDTGIVFSAFSAALAKDDLGAAANLIDDIYKDVGGDEYLLWYKARLLLMQNKEREVTDFLTEMENKYHADMSLAADNLPEAFLTSKEYKTWLSKHRKASKK